MHTYKHTLILFTRGYSSGWMAAFEWLVARDEVTSDSVPFETLQTFIYAKPTEEELRFVLPNFRITKKLVDSAKYMNKRPANVPTPEKLKTQHTVEALFKEQSKRDQEERKRKRLEEEKEAEEEGAGKEEEKVVNEPPIKRSTRRNPDKTLVELGKEEKKKEKETAPTTTESDSEPSSSSSSTSTSSSCRLLGHFPSDCTIGYPLCIDTGPILDVWTCGAVKKGKAVDHAHCHEIAGVQACMKAAEGLTKQLEGWRPEHDASDEDWRAFFIRREDLADFNVAEGSTVTQAVGKIFGLDIEAKEKKMGYDVVTRPLKHSLKTFFHRRWYYGGSRIDTKALSKNKAATTKMKAATRADTCVQFVVHCEDMCTFGWGLWVVGESKHLDGGLFCMCYSDCEQDHYHHGS